MPRDSGRRPTRRGRAAVTERPARLPSEIAEVAEVAAEASRPGGKPPKDPVKERIVARLRRLHPMD